MGNIQQYLRPTGAIQRWQERAQARARQMDAAYAQLHRTSGDYWDRRASSFHSATRDTAESSPIFPQLRGWISPTTSVLDVGAGAGRFSLALAPLAGHVTAVEPSLAMSKYLTDEARHRGIQNLRLMSCTWEDAPSDLRADVVLCIHVLYPLHDVASFVRKLDAAAVQRCAIHLRGVHPDSVTSSLWEYFHGEPRHLSPGYVDLVDVLAELGIFANVDVYELPNNWHWSSLEQAVQEMIEMLILPDSPEIRAELTPRLQALLTARNGGFSLPPDTLPGATVWWPTAH